ncbi:MAG: hypothetical protein DRP71_13230 [Verrucomicrobia bacterium]|nr:MAG: hypothetical protein DRP71_13230 [Verrucomicrobiota bacterium]
MKGRIISSPVFIWFVAQLISTYSWTFRLKVINEQPWRDHLENNGRVIFCSWHQQFFSFVHHFRAYRAYKPGLMISQSKDGELIAGVAHRMGWQTVRGSSSRGGLKAMRGMIQHIHDHRLGAHILDGPRGPVGVVKKGVIHMASQTNAILVPVTVDAHSSWKFRSWDRFFIPKPFARVCIRFGDMVVLPPSGAPDWLETQRTRLETIMLPALV